jgi:hypothetical protein
MFGSVNIASTTYVFTHIFGNPKSLKVAHLQIMCSSLGTISLQVINLLRSWNFVSFPRMNGYFSHMKLVSQPEMPITLLAQEIFLKFSDLSQLLHCCQVHTLIVCCLCFSPISHWGICPDAATIQKMDALWLCWRGYTEMLVIDLEGFWKMHKKNKLITNQTCFHLFDFVCDWPVGQSVIVDLLYLLSAYLLHSDCCWFETCCSCSMLATVAETWGARFCLTGRLAKDGNGWTLDTDG